MAFNLCSVFVSVACLNMLVLAHPLTYLRDNNVQPALVQPFQTSSVNYVNNIVDTSFQNGVPVNFVNGGYVQYPYTNGISSNFVNNVNNVNNVNGLGYPTVLQSSPALIASYPPQVQYGVPAFQPLGYNNPQNQLANVQSAPVQVNFS